MVIKSMNMFLMFGINLKCKRWKISTTCGLYLSHYLSQPAFGWVAMFSIKIIKLKIISDVLVYLSFKKGRRGRVS